LILFDFSSFKNRLVLTRNHPSGGNSGGNFSCPSPPAPPAAAPLKQFRNSGFYIIGSADGVSLKERTMRAPKFSVGQAVVYFPPRGLSAQRGAYRVTAELPLRSRQFEYRIKHQFEEHDRVATESDLSVLWN